MLSGVVGEDIVTVDKCLFFPNLLIITCQWPSYLLFWFEFLIICLPLYGCRRLCFQAGPVSWLQEGEAQAEETVGAVGQQGRPGHLLSPLGRRRPVQVALGPFPRLRSAGLQPSLPGCPDGSRPGSLPRPNPAFCGKRACSVPDCTQPAA